MTLTYTKAAVLMFLLLLVKSIGFSLLAGIPLGLGAFATTMGLLLIMAAVVCFIPEKWWMPILYGVNVIVTVDVISNLLYMDYYGAPMTVYTFYQIRNLQGLQSSIGSLFQWIYGLYLLDLIVLPFWRRKVRLVSGSRKPVYFYALVLFVMGAVLISLKPARMILAERQPFRKFDSLDLVKSYGIFGHQLLDAAAYAKGLHYSLSPSEKQRIDQWFQQKNTKKQDLSLAPSPLQGRKNLIMIQVESLQSFVINLKIGTEEVTPTLNRMLKHSYYFPHVYPQTIEGNSADAELLTQNSLYPIKTGSVYFLYPTNVYRALPAMLKKEGYHTLAVHGDEGSFWNRNAIYPSFGFEDFMDISDFRQDEKIGMGLGDKTMFRQSVSVLKQKGQPFYAFYITLSSHMPFEIPEKKQHLYLPSDLKATQIGRYLESIRYTDEALGMFLKQLEKNGLLNNSIIVLYGDHDGLFLKDRPAMERWIARKPISNETWWREFTPIPFLIYHPDIKGETRETIGGQVDILPTTLYMLGLDHKYSKWLMGKNLFAEQSGSAVIPHGDYAQKPIFITAEHIRSGLSKEQQEALDVSDLIIRGDYFKK